VVPGKHSMKKEDYLSSMMMVPPKQRIAIQTFDQRTQADAFTVSLEGLKGVWYFLCSSFTLCLYPSVESCCPDSRICTSQRRQEETSRFSMLVNCICANNSLSPIERAQEAAKSPRGASSWCGPTSAHIYFITSNHLNSAN
jgi:hypothetical protein